MVGRSEETAVIGEALTGSSHSGGVVLSGPAGVGKTRLARHALQIANGHGLHCRWIVATASAQSVPLGAFSDFATDVGPDPLRNVEAVIAALCPSAGTVVGVDDAHLLDDQSALVIHQLVRRRTAKVVLTKRIGAEAPAAISALWEDARLAPMEISALTPEQVHELLGAVLGGPVESSTAVRMWRYTQGNVLYLRQLVADELAADQIASRAGMWVWEREPQFSPTLIDLIESNIGRQSDDVVRVLDLLAVEEPLELPILLELSSQRGVDDAVTRGLVVIDDDSVRLAHPMFGEVRRSRAGKVRLRTLRGRVADALGAHGPTSPLQSIRQAVLLINSDAHRDPVLMIEAAGAALQLLNLTLATRLARAAVQNGGGRVAQLTYALTLAAVGRGTECERLLAHLAGAADDTERVPITVLRAANLASNVGQPELGLQVLDDADDTLARLGMTHAANGIRSFCQAALGHPEIAIPMAGAALDEGGVTGLPAVFASWALIRGHGDSGRIDRLSHAAVRGYAYADEAPEASNVRFAMGLSHVDGLRLAGELDRAASVTDELHRQSGDIDASHSVTALLAACIPMARGQLEVAQRLLREALAVGADRDGDSSAVRILAGLWLATVLAVKGDHHSALTELDAANRGAASEQPHWDTEITLARAWVHAASGLPTHGIELVVAAAERAGNAGRFARELVCLQTATQFGDTTTAPRLTALGALVSGPRVIAARAHAQALHDGDGPGLLAAAEAYEAFGDRIAAADAAAQAACAYRLGGLKGSLLTATAHAERLAGECGINTPALRSLASPVELTIRQREVIALAATGLSNKQIAESLHTSVRTVEGHLFRASQRAGVTTRDELVDMFSASRAPRHRGAVGSSR